ncbi:MAG: VCBS repeat-containing protein [Gammaproteobacteria bacterium]|nr:VCBS repeat-containing protein [Gammaproteobacteria bacterium]
MKIASNLLILLIVSMPTHVYAHIAHLGGVVNGLVGELVISDGFSHKLTLSANGPFTFDPQVYGRFNKYSVSITKQPPGMVCMMRHHKGRMLRKKANRVQINCYRQDAGEANTCANPLYYTEGAYSLSDSSLALGSGLGASGFSTFDSDEDGFSEILFGSGQGFYPNTSFSVMEYDQTESSYRVLCQSPQYEESIVRIISFSNDIHQAASLLALEDGSIQIVDHQLGSTRVVIETGLREITDTLLGDVDNDGVDEIAVSSYSRVNIYDANSFELKQVIPNGGQSMVMGHFTNRTKLELALNTGYVFYINAMSSSTVWDYSALGFSDEHLAAGDADNDGLDEIIAADSWYTITAYDADLKKISWEYKADLDISSLYFADFGSDSAPEVIYGDGQWGSIHGLNAQDGELLWSVSNPEHGVTAIHVADFDNDDKPELLWGAGYSSTGPDYLHLYDLVSNEHEWTSSDSAGPFYAVAYGDLDNDGIADRLYASLESAGDGTITAISSVTGKVLWETQANTFGNYTWTGLNALAVGDIDNDGQLEVLVGTDRLYDGYIYILNALDGHIEGHIELADSAPVYSLLVEDIDNDGRAEILVGGGVNSYSGNVFVIDGETTSLTKIFPSLGFGRGSITSMETVDFDHDGRKDVVAVRRGGAHVMGQADIELESSAELNFTALAVINSSVYMGDKDGNLSLMKHGAEISRLASLCSFPITALEDISSSLLAFSCNGRLGFYDLIDESVSWQSSIMIDANLGKYDTLSHEWVKGRSTLQIGGGKVYYFESNE